MAFQFPASPTLGQIVINPVSGINFTWNGTTWSSTPFTASFAVTASYTPTASIAYQVGSQVFTNQNTEFSWFSPVNGNPTASGGIITGNGNTAFSTANNFDGVRLINTAAGANRSGSVYWDDSEINFDCPEGIWCTWNTRNSDGFFGTILNINSLNPPTGSQIGNVTSSGVSIYMNESTEQIEISKDGSLITTFSPIGSLFDNALIQWDAVFFKSGSNYFLNLYEGYPVNVGTGVEYGLGKTFSYPIPVSTSNNNVTTINLGTTMPTGQFLGFYARSGLSTSTITSLVNRLQVRSAALAPLLLGPYGKTYGFQ